VCELFGKISSDQLGQLLRSMEKSLEIEDSTDRLVTSLSNQIDACLHPLIPNDSNVALLDFPDYPNIGDNLLWLGEWEYLRRRRAKIVYACDIDSCSLERLAEKVGNGTILLSGGGNFGDLYPRYQRFREKIISTFPRNRIIQLPQSIYFEHRASALEARKVLSRHLDFTLMVRDHKSFDFAERELCLKPQLCPDMAFALGRISRADAPSHDIVWLSRSDRESLHYPHINTGQEIQKVDWPTDIGTLSFRTVAFLDRQFVLHPNFLRRLSRLRLFTLTQLASQRVKRGVEILRKGRVVVTDRLHGYILALLMRLPHVILDNSYGKVRNFHETWTKSSELTRCAETPEFALKIAKAWMLEIKQTAR
jgi:exopolysaccharide biosynthesis predicted pyruvyltransferase EpsI